MRHPPGGTAESLKSETLRYPARDGHKFHAALDVATPAPVPEAQVEDSASARGPMPLNEFFAWQSRENLPATCYQDYGDASAGLRKT